MPTWWYPRRWARWRRSSGPATAGCRRHAGRPSPGRGRRRSAGRSRRCGCSGSPCRSGDSAAVPPVAGGVDRGHGAGEFRVLGGIAHRHLGVVGSRRHCCRESQSPPPKPTVATTKGASGTVLSRVAGLVVVAEAARSSSPGSPRSGWRRSRRAGALLAAVLVALPPDEAGDLEVPGRPTAGTRWRSCRGCRSR